MAIPRGLLVSVAVVSTVAILAVLASAPLRWRAGLVGAKAVGAMPGVPWSHILAGVLPHRVRDAVGFESLRVTRVRSGGGQCPVLWETSAGTFWGRPEDRHPLEMALKYRLYDEFYLRGDASLRRGDVVIDAGAHLGTFTALALHHGARRVVLLEPDPINAACLRQTFPPGASTRRLDILEEAVWDHATRLAFEETPSSLQGRVPDPRELPVATSAKIFVSATTIDAVVADLRLDRVDVIKLSVEGAERNALRGARDTIRRFRPRLIVNLEHHADDPDVIPALVRTILPGYRAVWRGREEVFLYYPARDPQTSPS